MRGFTLMETIVYFALLSVLMTCAVEALRSIEYGSARVRQAAIAAREGAFVAEKLRWEFIHEPDARIELDEVRYAILLREDGESVPLTSENVRAESLSIEPVFGADGARIGTEASFTIDGTAFAASAYEAP
jgi:hypothetical protein